MNFRECEETAGLNRSIGPQHRVLHRRLKNTKKMIDRNFCVGNQVSAVMSLVCWNYLTILQLLHGWADPKTGNLFYLSLFSKNLSLIYMIYKLVHASFLIIYTYIIPLIVFYLALNFIGEIDSHTCEHRSVAWSLLIITPNCMTTHDKCLVT